MLREMAVPSGKAVLIVEDADTCATTLELAFSSIDGVQVVLAPTALEALRILEDDDREVRAVVTDLNLPRMDGFELIRRIRSGRRYARVPIIVVSGDTDPGTPERTLHLGADAFFPKPYSPTEVRQKLEQLLNAYQT